VSRKNGFAAFVTCQDEYSMLVRGIERDRVAVMQRHGMTLLPYAPLAGGFLTGKYQRGRPLPANARLAYSSHHASDVLNERNWAMLEQIGALAKRSGFSMLELAFGWLLAQPVTASVIAGASTPEQIERNVSAGNTKLSADVLDALDRITR
jgi:aryl-alcohol dehydrogenase-like predicted oxidoreductase